MKNLLVAFIAFISVSVSAQTNIKGNGNVIKETREVSNFSRVSLAGNVNVQLSFGNSPTITVEGDENVLPYIETVIENETLIVRTKNKTGINSKNKLIVYASMTKIEELKVSGSGNITGNGEFTNNEKTSLSVSGSGNITVGIASFNETKIAISGSGNVTLKGESTNNIDATISGSGNIDCSGVSCNNVFAKVSGSGNIRVYANRSIDAKVSGSGNIYYKGAATNINLKSAGSGKIIKA
ncbi:MAG TPA: head GIN domain-containing protein [Segetibacter sp.]|jgi:hypothetical protein